MSDIFGIKRLKTIEDWVEVVSARHYKKDHSAFEVAQKWRNVGYRLPEPIASIFQNSGVSGLRGIEILQVYAEYPVFLTDSFKSPSKCDLMIFCRSPLASKIVIAVEAKCMETFSERVTNWIRAPDSSTNRRQRKLFQSPNPLVDRKVDRLDALNKVLSLQISTDSEIRYQLLHRTASAILTARQTFADIAIVLIQAFTQSDANFSDFVDFCRVLGIRAPEKDAILGPYYSGLTPKIPIYLVYVQDRRQSDPPASELF